MITNNKIFARICEINKEKRDLISSFEDEIDSKFQQEIESLQKACKHEFILTNINVTGKHVTYKCIVCDAIKVE